VIAFNAQGDSQPTNVANARTADGANGLRGEYYDNSDLTGLKLTRTDGTVNFVWWESSPDPLVGVDSFSVRWTGQVEAQFSETYTFYTSTDDGVRLWVNGVQLVNDWVNHAETERSGTIALVAGQKYNIKMEYYEASGGAAAKLLWSSASTAKAAIPNTRLFPSMSVAASADAFVRDGTHANTNNGSATTLDVKASTSGFTRYSYLTFDLTQLGNISSAKLRLFGGLNSADSLNISIFDVSDTTWGESTLTFNNRPANGTTALATTTINSTTAQWWEWDLTSYLQQQLALGRTSVSLLLKSDFSTTAAAVATFNSDEAITDRPALVVTA
jgi:hypothetical protein